MSYKMEYIKNEGIVKITILGRINYSTAKQYSSESIKIARENKCKYFIIDHSKTKLTSGIYKLYADGNTLEQFGFLVKDKVAIIIKGKADNILLSEEPNKNIKWSNIKYFNSIKKATLWFTE